MVACAVELSAHFGKEALEPLVELGRKSTGFWFMMLLMCVHGVNAKSLKEHTCNETTLTLGWILMFGFCLQCLPVAVELHVAHLQTFLRFLLETPTELVTRSGCSLVLL